MKKHIRKKYLFQQKLEFNIDGDNNSFKQLEKPFDQNELKYHKDDIVVIQTHGKDVYWGFVYNNSGTYVHMPLPDFTLVYFDYAYKANISRREVQKDLLNKLANADTMTEDRSHELYQFYGVATSCIINLFTSIESFVNHLLPENEVYILNEKIRTETYNRDQIQRFIQFNEKLKKVIPYFLGKNFFQKPTPTTQHIENLKELRDALVHTKAGESFKNHTETFKRLLNFKYTETFDAVVHLFNYYQPGYIEDCPCEKDF